MKIYFSILSYGKKWFTHGWISIFFLLLNSFFNVVSLSMTIPFLEILFSDSVPQYPGPLEWTSTSLKAHLNYELLSYAQEVGKFQLLVRFTGVLALAIFLKNLCRYGFSWLVVALEQGIVFTMRKHLFGHLSTLSLDYYTGERKGEIINVMVNDVQIIQESVVGTFRTIVRDPITMITFLFTMIFISWKLTLFSLLILPITGFLINIITKSIKRKAHQSQRRLGKLIGVIDEFVGGIRIVKSFAKEEYERKKYAEENDAYQGMMVALSRRADLASPLTEVLSIFVVIGIILFGGKMILDGSGELSPAEFIGFIALFSQFLAPLKTMATAVSKVQRGVASYERVQKFLTIKSKITEKENCLPIREFTSEISFENVSFSYGQEEVLSNVNFTLKKGETVALVGPSGGGKSTLADLVPRFYDPVAGKILLDGVDIRDYCLADLRKLFGIVTQEGILFNSSVASNIAYGEENPDMDRLREAAGIANAAGFISELPEGYATEIGERGTRLSGGQRQRLAIARAVYRNPPILILDEATSALDSESEKLVQEAFNNLTRDRTSLIIAHRLSTIIHAHKILVIDQGKVVEQGTHTELLKLNGLYRSLHDLQFRLED
ncbi:MAG: ABC transporter ATP-binding protein [Bacteroidia bacterium]|nr:ABC transporter ATP-binding protein [Bacteroidia bacterium]